MRGIATGALAVMVILGGSTGTSRAGGGAGSGSARKSTASSKAVATSFAGPVKAVIRAGGYVYVQLEVGGEGIWAAAPAVPVEVGQNASFQDGMPKEGYRSQSLGIVFDRVYFAQALAVGGVVQAPEPEPEPELPSKPTVDLSGITRPEGGKTIGELFAEKAALAGKEVLLRARVVKASGRIMDRHWIHLQDGTGGEGTNDLTVTSQTAGFQAGDTVLVRGKVTTDKDLGFGYFYALILEDANITKE